jgi:hypothetical protein
MTVALSIVVAVQGGADRLNSVLGALEAQLGPDDEVLVPYAAEEQSVPAACASYPFARPLLGTRGALIPELWRDGIEAAAGARVALSVVHCRPARDWVERLRTTNLKDHVAVGGSFVNAPGADALGWAVFLLRYLRYTPEAPSKETGDLPGDNALYDRETVLAYREAFRDGFWEPEVHALMLRDGKRLLFDPNLESVHANGYRTLEFALQRFRHAVRFGRSRARDMSAPRRALQIALAPAVPLIFGNKVVRAAWSQPVFRQPLVRSLPHLALFLHAWAAGELVGTLLPGRRAIT